jgi:hypothetical protein
MAPEKDLNIADDAENQGRRKVNTYSLPGIMTPAIDENLVGGRG